MKYADLANMPEDARIQVIGQTAALGQKVGFFVDDNTKADRYIEKLTTRFDVVVLERKADVLVKGTVFVRVGPKP